MSRFTSGLYGTNDEFYAVNEKYYNIKDDKTCLRFSVGYHGIDDVGIEKSINNGYNIKYLKIKYLDNSMAFNVNIFDEYIPGCCKCRVYDLLKFE